jgi:hypothetical protein
LNSATTTYFASVVIKSFDAVESELLTSSLNKLQIHKIPSINIKKSLPWDKFLSQFHPLTVVTQHLFLKSFS